MTEPAISQDTRLAKATFSLSFKIVTVVLAISVIGIAGTTFIVTRSLDKDFRSEFEASRGEITRQIAASASGAIRWKKADVVAEAYKSLVEDPSKPIAALTAVTAAGEVLAQYSEPGADTTRLVNLPKAMAGAPATMRTIRLGNELVSIAPAGKDASGAPYGYLVIAWKTDAVTKLIASVRLELIGVLALTMLTVVAVILIAFARLVGRPLTAIGGRMVALANLDTAMPIPYADRNDEIGIIARSVGTFREREVKRLHLEEKQHREDQQRQSRQERIDGLVDNFRAQAKGLLGDVTVNMSEMEKTAGELARTATVASSQATAVTSASRDASANVRVVAGSTEQLARSIHEISETLTRTTAVVSQADSDASASAKRMAFLSQAADQIGAVVHLIRSIADQTNLLALNATIEAARAGEAGKGFAVVASEVKNLATQTAKATEEIAGQIGEIQGSIHDATKGIDGITRTITEVNTLAMSIAVAIEEQASATSEIGRNVQEAERGSSTVMTTAGAVASSIEQTAQVAGMVDGAANRVRETAASLNLAVDTFLRDVAAA